MRACDQRPKMARQDQEQQGRDFERRRPDYIALSVLIHLVISAGRYVVTNNPD